MRPNPTCREASWSTTSMTTGSPRRPTTTARCRRRSPRCALPFRDCHTLKAGMRRRREVLNSRRSRSPARSASSPTALQWRGRGARARRWPAYRATGAESATSRWSGRRRPRHFHAAHFVLWGEPRITYTGAHANNLTAHDVGGARVMRRLERLPDARAAVLHEAVQLERVLRLRRMQRPDWHHRLSQHRGG
jgi:hypothetical protein